MFRRAIRMHNLITKQSRGSTRPNPVAARPHKINTNSTVSTVRHFDFDIYGSIDNYEYLSNAGGNELQYRVGRPNEHSGRFRFSIDNNGSDSFRCGCKRMEMRSIRTYKNCFKKKTTKTVRSPCTRRFQFMRIW